MPALRPRTNTCKHIRMKPPFQLDETVAVIKGPYKGRIGRIVKVGSTWLLVQFQDTVELLTVSKKDILRSLK